jgi:hypothetical protein
MANSEHARLAACRLKKLRAPSLTLARRCDAPTTVPFFVAVFFRVVNPTVWIGDSVWKFSLATTDAAQKP